MSLEYCVLITGFIFGFYMSWNIGANDVANSMASSVGAKAITIKQAIVLAGVLNIVGAVFIGSHVAKTISKGIVSTEILADPHAVLLGSLSALLAAALWVSFATWKSLPVSTTHSIVGAMIGFGIIVGGFNAIQWGKVMAVVASWIISPFFSFIIAFFLFKLIVKAILSKQDAFSKALSYAPVFIGMTIFVVVLSFLFKTPMGKNLSLDTSTAIMTALIIAVILGITGTMALKYFVKNRQENDAEPIFKRIQVGTACYVALAQGANDVANAIGPLAVIYSLVQPGIDIATMNGVDTSVQVPFFLLLFGGVGIACGIAMAGARVMDTIGRKITTLTNARGFAVEFAAATTVMCASKLGLPVSTTHAAVGGVLGVGMARGIEAVNFKIVYKIMLYWILTVPAAAVSSMIIFKILQFFL